jgi:hypothetical protein
VQIAYKSVRRDFDGRSVEHASSTGDTMRKHLKTVSSTLCALGLVVAALVMSSSAMANTTGCTYGNPNCNTPSGAYFHAWVQQSGGYYYTCREASNPSSTSKTLYFRYTDQNQNLYHDYMPSGKAAQQCDLTGYSQDAINTSVCGFDTSCG